tara:strand:- start:21933 stop:22058 length:126 start_codon:yes stop_codon:yes gene_type:complete
MEVIQVQSIRDVDSCKVIDDNGKVLFEGNQRECDDYVMENI